MNSLENNIYTSIIPRFHGRFIRWLDLKSRHHVHPNNRSQQEAEAPVGQRSTISVWPDNADDARQAAAWFILVLYLLVAMWRLLAALMFITHLSHAWQVETRLVSPTPGQAIQGTVTVRVEGLSEANANVEVLFRYQDDPTPTRFLIFQGQAAAEGVVAEWDTTTISDGDYTMQVLIRYADGREETLQAAGLRVRNYNAIETDTPPAPLIPPPPATPTSTPDRSATRTVGALKQTAAINTPLTPGETSSATPNATPTPSATPAPLPPPQTNPAALAPLEVEYHLGRGVLAGLGLMVLGALFVRLRRAARRARS